MDRFRQKNKKEKPTKYPDKEKPSLFIADVKSIKENLKIKEILRTVKMNSSMRVKAPRGSKVMTSKDFNDNEDSVEGDKNNDDTLNNDILEPPSATNPDVIVKVVGCENDETSKEDLGYMNGPDMENIENKLNEVLETDDSKLTSNESLDLLDNTDSNQNLDNKINQTLNEYLNIKHRERKLSLDHTILTRREGLSQSELDLHSIGKSPLERKSSFFRKKMDSFFKNTTEIFKRQSLNSKNQPIQRRGSMSMSLQSLNEKTCTDFSDMPIYPQEVTQGSVTSLQSSSSTVGRSSSSLSTCQGALQPAHSEQGSLAGSQPILSASQPLGGVSSDSVHSLNEAHIQDLMFNSRAISMSSGLDSASGQRLRKASRSNRVTWVASESLTNYLRRVIQDESSKEMQVCQSYSDFSSIPENELCNPKLDSKGRRLSYQRAVSGEDPVPSTKYKDSSLRRRPFIPENSEV